MNAKVFCLSGGPYKFSRLSFKFIKVNRLLKEVVVTHFDNFRRCVMLTADRNDRDCFHYGFRCIRPTPTETQSMSENDIECFANSGVNTPGTMFPNFRSSF
jgi:hypothetical protein